MMNANFRDPKLFSQLVKKKKSNASGHTTMIKFDDNEFRGDSQVLAGFSNTIMIDPALRKVSIHITIIHIIIQQLMLTQWPTL